MPTSTRSQSNVASMKGRQTRAAASAKKGIDAHSQKKSRKHNVEERTEGQQNDGSSKKQRVQSTKHKDEPASAPEPAASLAEASSNALTTTPLNTAELEKLPQHMLVQLLGKVAAERDTAEAKVKTRDDEVQKLNDELKTLKQNRYLVDPSRTSDRVDLDVWEDRIQQVLEKWEPRTTAEGWKAYNSQVNYMMRGKRLVYDEATKSFELLRMSLFNFNPYNIAGQTELYRVMSSALLQYRLCCLFAGTHIKVEGWEGYKAVWSAELKHKATGESLGFGEWKGAAQISVSNMEGPAEFENDMLELLNVLYDANCPHPYDGCVAGCVA